MTKFDKIEARMRNNPVTGGFKILKLWQTDRGSIIGSPVRAM